VRLVAVEVLALDVPALVDCQRLLGRLDLPTKRELPPLAFPVGKNCVVNRPPVAAAGLVLAPSFFYFSPFFF
jgi:hypothetical protein